MATRQHYAFQGVRAPLGEATDRINNSAPKASYKSSRSQEPELEPNPLRARHSDRHSYGTPTPRPGPGDAASIATSVAASTPIEQQVPGVSGGEQDEDKRNSQISTSTASSGKHKTHIGPWNLGKTLGRGSASRVRLARHQTTGQLAAVKILSRNSNQMSQAGSLVELDKWDRRRGEYASENYIPLAIEREIAMLKLIDHPNIVKLYDIWENRQEM